MNAPPSSSLPYLSNQSQPIVMQQPSSVTNVQMPHQDVNQRFPASLPTPQTPQSSVQSNPSFTPSHDKQLEIIDLTGSKSGANFQSSDNQLSTKRRDSIQYSPPSLDQPQSSNAPMTQVSKSHETKSNVEETSSPNASTRIITPSSSNSVSVPNSLWLYQNLLKNFKVTSSASNSVDEVQYLRQILKLFLNVMFYYDL